MVMQKWRPDYISYKSYSAFWTPTKRLA